jgi:Holliday junction resolvasome RuvABC endonuclease subunit
VKTLTLDISTHTGWALLEGQEVLESGTTHLATKEELDLQRREGKERTLELRFSRLYTLIVHFIKERGVERIVFEDVLFSSTQMQGQLWASLRSTIWAICQEHPIQVFGVPVGTLKVFATGSGSAKKPEMANALASLEPGSSVEMSGENVFLRKRNRVPADDNEIDALWLARYTMAVDRGDKDFLGVYQRKSAEKAQRRRKRADRKAASKSKKLADQEEQKAKQQAMKDAINAAGKCCGVLRKPGKFGRAVCPKCGQSIKLDMTAKEAQSEPQPDAQPAVLAA